MITYDRGISFGRRCVTELLTEQPAIRELSLLDVLERASDRAAGSGTVEIHCPTEPTVTAVPQLELAVAELVTNALVHTDAPEPAVTVSVEAADDCVRIEVVDSNPEIPPMERALPLGEEETPLHHGEGLGLWFVSLVAEHSGGSMTFDTTEAGGNVVRLTL